MANFFFNFLSAISNVVVVTKRYVAKQNVLFCIGACSFYFLTKRPSAEDKNVVEQVSLVTNSLCSNLSHETLLAKVEAKVLISNFRRVWPGVGEDKPITIINSEKWRKGGLELLAMGS